MAVVIAALGLYAVVDNNPPHRHTRVTIGPTSTIDGVAWHEVDLPGGDGTRTLWIYTPATKLAKVPCILIAPSGSNCFEGKPLTDGTHREHVPYANAGYLVVAYSLDGAQDAGGNGYQEITSIKAFRNAQSGLDDEKAALDYAEAIYPNIDRTRIYAVGHSSAGTMAILAATRDPRIRGCIAYAPRCDVRAEMDKPSLDTLSRRVPGFSKFVTQCSPIESATNLHCPAFLFHADDDASVPKSDLDNYLKIVRPTNSHITYVHVPTGGHSQSMIEVGIPDGLNWLKSQ